VTSLWAGLAARVAIGVLAATLAVAFDGLLSLRVDPYLALLTGVVAAVAWWAFAQELDPEDGPEWRQPSWHSRSPHFQADVRTRRLASTLVHTQPGQAFDARRLARQLADLTARRLVTSGRVAGEDAADPLAHAERHLSPALLAYLRSAKTDRPQVLGRRALHAHLKEIDSL